MPPAKRLAGDFRNRSLPVQDKIIAKLEELLLRLERNEQARKELRKIEKKDKAGHKALTTVLGKMVQGLDELLKDQTDLAGKFERLPKRDPDKMKEETLKALKDLEELKKKANKWAKGSVNELTKMPTGFVDDFKLRPDAKKIYEEVEKAAQRSKSEKIEVSLEDLGAGLATKMKEDLEMWLADVAGRGQVGVGGTAEQEADEDSRDAAAQGPGGSRRRSAAKGRRVRRGRRRRHLGMGRQP